MMAEADINTPPAQDSPKNIVNILNDDCIQLVLLKLKDLPDFWSAAQVCTKFQANAKACFPFKMVKFGYTTYTNEVPFDIAEEFLTLFGPRIKSIFCDLTSNRRKKAKHDKNFSLISQYCGQTLTELDIFGFNDIVHLRSPFQILKHLKLWCVSFYNFNPSLQLPELESLEMRDHLGDSSVEWLKNQFPMLQHVKVEHINRLADDTFIEFQNRNPQLQSLNCQHCICVTSAAWRNIGDRLPNIVDLSLDRVGKYFTHLSTLRQLRKLHLVGDSKFIPSRRISLFSALVENNQPIEELTIRCVDTELGRILQKLTTIKVLQIFRTPVDIVVDLVNHLPALEYLHLHNFTQSIRLSTVTKFLQNCKKMKKIVIGHVLLFDGTTDSNEFEAIIALATGRVELHFDYMPNYAMRVAHEYKYMLKNLLRDRSNEWVRFKRHPYRRIDE